MRRSPRISTWPQAWGFRREHRRAVPRCELLPLRGQRSGLSCPGRRRGGRHVSEASPTRAVVLELKVEQRAMHEGYVFLDEKCLLLAGEILRELARYAQLDRVLLDAHKVAIETLQAAVARHGLQDLQIYPPLDQTMATLYDRDPVDHGRAPGGRFVAIGGQCAAAVGRAVAGSGSVPARVPCRDRGRRRAGRRQWQSGAALVRIPAVGTAGACAAGCPVAGARSIGLSDRDSPRGTRAGRCHLHAASCLTDTLWRHTH